MKISENCDLYSQDEIDELLELQALNKSDLKILEQQFAILESKYKTIMEERRIKQETIDRHIAELRTKCLASVKIQSFWRGYKVRMILRGRILGGKKKGKGKGKEKKK